MKDTDKTSQLPSPAALYCAVNAAATIPLSPSATWGQSSCSGWGRMWSAQTSGTVCFCSCAARKMACVPKWDLLLILFLLLFATQKYMSYCPLGTGTCVAVVCFLVVVFSSNCIVVQPEVIYKLQEIKARGTKKIELTGRERFAKCVEACSA